MDVGSGVLVGEGSSIRFDSNTLTFFSIGEFFASKLIMVMANANQVVERGGAFKLTFEFTNSGTIEGNIRYSLDKSTGIERVAKFDDIYSLMELGTTIAAESLGNAK